MIQQVNTFMSNLLMLFLLSFLLEYLVVESSELTLSGFTTRAMVFTVIYGIVYLPYSKKFS